MCKKLVCLISLVLMLGLAGSASAYIYWDNDACDGDWNNPINWVGNKLPINDKACLKSEPGPILADPNTLSDCNCASISLGGSSPEGDPCGTLIVGGRTLTIAGGYGISMGQSAAEVGRIFMNSGTIDIDDGGMRVGRWGKGTIYMNGGTIKMGTVDPATATFAIGVLDAVTAQGYVHLDGGTIECENFRMCWDPGGGGSVSSLATCSLDVNDGTLIVDGDRRDRIDGYIGNGWITAYNNGERSFCVVTYNAGTDKTTVTARERNDALAWNPKPKNGAGDVERSPVLSWTPGNFAPGTNGHYVYFGETRDPCQVTTPSQPQTPNNYTPGDLVLDKTYYWRIDEVNGGGVDTGLLWSFTVAEYVVVDDMEYYNSTSELKNTWYDGNEVVKTSGSVISLETDANFVHEGSRAMKYEYNNSGSTGAPLYSEIEANTVDLAIGSDWTIAKVKAMYLYFYGQANNDANSTEQMYVALKDGSNNTAVVPYYGDASNVQREEWMVWRIDLDDFSGVSLNNVQKVYIGFGDRYAPALGGTGTVYFDDTRLYISRCLGWDPALGGKDWSDADYNEDCTVDFEDVGTFVDNWLETGMR